MTRYFYNASSRECQQFIYGGCDGNANNFESMNLCEEQCERPLSPGEISPGELSSAAQYYNRLLHPFNSLYRTRWSVVKSERYNKTLKNIKMNI